ncbi:hypothetical protein MW887_008668 [Aspergillus wentii]|nr:hypothetical protein MW887_008668 [Aspergillus wentii]
MFFPSPRNSVGVQVELLQQLQCWAIITPAPQPVATKAILDEHPLRALEIPDAVVLLDKEYPRFPYSKMLSQAASDPLLVIHTSGLQGCPNHGTASKGMTIFSMQPPPGYEARTCCSLGGESLRCRLHFIQPPTFLCRGHRAATLILVSGIGSTLSYWNSSLKIPEQGVETKTPIVNGYMESIHIAEHLLKYASDQLFFPSSYPGRHILPVQLNPKPSGVTLVAESCPWFNTQGAMPDTLGTRLTHIDWVPVDLLRGVLVDLALDDNRPDERLQKVFTSGEVHTLPPAEDAAKRSSFLSSIPAVQEEWPYNTPSFPDPWFLEAKYTYSGTSKNHFEIITMGLFSHHEEDYEKVVNAEEGNQAHLSHELIAGAAAYEASKAWEDHKAAAGGEVSHSKAKEFLAGAAGAFAVKIAETKGRDFLDKRKLERDAQEYVKNNYAE